MFSRVKRPTFRPTVSRQRGFSRTTKTSVGDFCDISYPLAGPDRSHQATTERRIGRKPRKFRDKFESTQSPAKTLYNNDLSVAEGEGFEPSVRVYPVQRFSKPPPSTTRPPLRLGAGERPAPAAFLEAGTVYVWEDRGDCRAMVSHTPAGLAPGRIPCGVRTAGFSWARLRERVRVLRLPRAQG